MSLFRFEVLIISRDLVHEEYTLYVCTAVSCNCTLKFVYINPEMVGLLQVLPVQFDIV